MTLPRLDAVCVRGLLRCLGAGPRGPSAPATFRLKREDVDALRFWWSLSSSVGRLAERVRARPREIQGSLGAEERIAQGEIPGALDACATALVQTRSGDPSLFAVVEPAPTWLSGPNRLLALTLLDAERSIHAASRRMSGGIFSEIIAERMRLVEESLRVSALREILMTPAGRARLTPHERRQALKARAPIYRLAYEAAETLRGVESLDAATLAALFTESLLPALEPWRRFEIACVLEAGLALSRATGRTAVLDASFSSSRPCVTVGEFSVRWQTTVPSRPYGDLDPGERMTRDLVASLGISGGSGRADAIVEKNGRIVSLIECKWFSDPSSATDAVWDACGQLTRYARDEAFLNGGSASALLEHSLVALADRGAVPVVTSAAPVGCIDLHGIEDGALDAWAARVIALP